MSVYILKRILWFIPVLILTLTLLFIIMQILPGDPIQAAFGSEIPLSPERLAAVREELGLDQPLYIRYFTWWWDLLHGNLGISFYSTASVNEELATRIPVTFGLITLSMLIMIIFSVPSGILAGYYHNKWPDWLIRIISVLFISLPHFWLATMAILIALIYFGWSVSLQYVTVFNDPINAFKQMILPALIMGLRPVAVAARMIRSSLVEVMEEDYIRTGRAKGLSETLLTWRHALPNTLLPVVTYYGLEVIVLIGASVVMEGVFSLPGLGSLIIRSAKMHDYYVLQGCVIILLFLSLFMNLFVDILYAWLDPRVRYANAT
jgi:peptide/nickel transport system permease protein